MREKLKNQVDSLDVKLGASNPTSLVRSLKVSKEQLLYRSPIGQVSSSGIDAARLG